METRFTTSFRCELRKPDGLKAQSWRLQYRFCFVQTGGKKERQTESKLGRRNCFPERLMKSNLSLATKTIKELQVLARGAGIAGWHDLRKNDLIEAIQRMQKATGASSKSKSRPKGVQKGKAERTQKTESKSVAKNQKQSENLSKKSASAKTAAPSSSVSTPVKEGKRQPVRKRVPGKSDSRTAKVVPAVADTGSKSSGSRKKAAPVTKNETVTKHANTSSTGAASGLAREPVRKKATPVKSPAKPALPVQPVSSDKKVKSDTSAKTKSSSSIASGPIRQNSASAKKATNTQTGIATTSAKSVSSAKSADSAKSSAKKDTKAFAKPENQGSASSNRTGGKSSVSGSETKPVPTEAQKKISVLKEKLLLYKTLGTDATGMDREPRNQLILMVRDPFWLHAYWEMSSQLVDRIRAAMGHLWHTADPVLRLYRMHTDVGGTLRKEYLRDIRIHGGINNWYIDVDDPPSSFLVEIGYLARDGQFFILLSSNIVETPQRYVHDSFGHPDVSWTGTPTDFQLGHYQENGGGENFSGNGGGLDMINRTIPSFGAIRPNAASVNWSDTQKEFGIKVDAELVIKGQVTPHVQVTIKGENIRLKEDGTFSIRYHLPERRHVFPIAAVSPDGVETKTIILAVERNTKILETVVRDEDDE